MERSDNQKLKEGMKLIRLMKGDIITALRDKVPLVIEGEGPLKALLTVVEVAENATAKALAPILGPDGRVAG